MVQDGVRLALAPAPAATHAHDHVDVVVGNAVFLLVRRYALQRRSDLVIRCARRRGRTVAWSVRVGGCETSATSTHHHAANVEDDGANRVGRHERRDRRRRIGQPRKTV